MKRYSVDKIRNVALVGHGGVGKTTLLEHLLFSAGATDRLGSVDSGNSSSDHDAQEIKRKISLNLSVLPIEWQDCKINVIDVPGFPDFIGELHSIASVVDALIIVTAAQKDLDVGFENAWELGERYGIPRIVFVNKMERDNADYEGLLETLLERYGRQIAPLDIPLGHQATFHGVVDVLEMVAFEGSDKDEHAEPIPSDVLAQANEKHALLMDAAAEGDDDLAMKYLDGTELTPQEMEHGLEVGVANCKVTPLLIGSALKGIGVHDLLGRIIGLVPPPSERPPIEAVDGNDNVLSLKPDPAGQLAAFAFKTTADPYVGRLTYLKVVSGTLRSDSTVRNSNRDHDERLAHLSFPHGKQLEAAAEVCAGDICVVSKLQDTHTGDTLCDKGKNLKIEAMEYPTPIFSLAVTPATKNDEDKLGPALQRLAEEDQTFEAHRDAALHQTVISGMGDVHLDVVIERLKTKFGVNVNIEEAKVPYRETIKANAKAQGKFKRQTGGKGQYGDCWLRLEPQPRGEGFAFGDEVVGGSIPRNYIPAVEKGVREIMEHGFLAGYPVVDVKAVVYDGSYHDVDSNEAAFKSAGKLAFENAAKTAQPALLEPIVELDVIVPERFLGAVMSDLNGRRGRTLGQEAVGVHRQRVKANVPQAEMKKYALELRSITQGRGKFSTSFSHYEEVPTHIAQILIEQYQKERKEHEG